MDTDISLGKLALAETCLLAGKFADGRKCGLQSLALTKELFGVRHQDTIKALEVLALLDQREGKHADAKIRDADAVRIAADFFGESSTATLALQRRLVVVKQTLPE